jgi:hypothetical protein
MARYFAGTKHHSLRVLSPAKSRSLAMTASRQIDYRRLPLLLALVTLAAPAAAADTYLQLIPNSALAWGAVNHIEAAAGRLQNLTKVMQIPAPNLLDTIKKEGGTEKGLDEKAAIGFFIMPGKWMPNPPVVFFYAVTDAKEFRSNFEVVKPGEKISEIKLKTPFGSTVPGYLAFLHGYALIADQNKEALEAAVNSKQSIAADMSGYESWLAECDACAVGTDAGIKYSAEYTRKDMGRPDRSGGDTMKTAAFAKSFQSILDSALVAAPGEISLAMAGIRCDKQGAIRVSARARLRSDGKLAKNLAEFPPIKENLLSTVPGGPFVLAAAGVGIPGLMDAYINLYTEWMKSMQAAGAGGDDATKMIKESLESARQFRSMSFVWKQGKRSDPIYSNMHATVKVEDSARYLAAQQRYVDRFDKLAQEGKAPGVKSMEAKVLQVAGKTALLMETTINYGEVPGVEQSRPMFDALFGVGNKMLVYNVATDEHTVLMGIGVPQERMASAVEVLSQPKRSLAEGADLSATLAMLPEKPQWVAFISPRGIVQMVTRFVTTVSKSAPGAEGPGLPAFSKSPPLGLAVKAARDEITAEIAVPAPLVEAAGGFAQEMQKVRSQRMMQQGQPPAP